MQQNLKEQSPEPIQLENQASSSSAERVDIPAGISAEQAARVANKRYFSIGEVGDICQVKTHVLRYWEQEFSQLSPIKRRGNRRYYTRRDVFLVFQIKNLLYSEGFTIEGARAQLSQKQSKTHHQVKRSHQVIQSVLTQLEEIQQSLQYDEG